MAATLEELGQLLRLERENKGLSVDDVADGLKISERILRALEAGDSTSLPHIVYVRGFVSAYGKYLDLDVQELLASPALYEDGEDKPQYLPLDRTAAVKKRNSGRLFFILLLCICIGGAAGVWAYQNTETFDFFKKSFDEPSLNIAEPAPALTQDKEKTLVSASQEAPLKTAPKDASQASEEQATTEKNKQDAATQKAQAEKALAEKEAAEKAQAQKALAEKEAAEKAQAQKAAAEKEAAQKAQAQKEQEARELAKQNVAVTPSAEDLPQHRGPHKVIITALMESSIESAADDTGTRTFSLKPGDTFALTFDDTLRLTLSNAGGVRIHYNGKVMPSLGNKGEKKTVVFPPRL